MDEYETTTVEGLREYSIELSLEFGQFAQAAILRLLPDEAIVNGFAKKYGFTVEGWFQKQNGQWERVQ